MNPLSEVLKSKRINDSRGMQKVLRELDMHILALSLININDNERKIIYRNTSKRVVIEIEKEIEILSHNQGDEYVGIDKIKIQDAQKIVAEMIVQLAQEYEKPTIYQKYDRDVNFNTYDDLLNTFIDISDHTSKNGLLSIEGIQNSTDNELFKKGIDLIVDGTDPLIVDEILENYTKSMLHRYSTKLKMISSAIKAIQMGLPSTPIIDKLNSLKN